MSSPATLRTRVILAVTIVRQGGKQVAHTLDVTADSARLGGVSLPLQAGEIIELQRGAQKAKFKVSWMGTSGSPLQGQAGVISLEQKSIWHLFSLSGEPSGLRLEAASAPPSVSPARAAAPQRDEKRRDQRYPCSGGVSIQSAGVSFAVYAEAKDLSQGGIYVETTSPLPSKCEVALGVRIDNTGFEAKGVVCASYPMVGMGIRFHDLSPQNREKLSQILERLKQQDAEKKRVGSEPDSFRLAGTEKKPEQPTFRLDARTMAAACRKLAADFDVWKSTQPEADMEQLWRAVGQLQQKFSMPSPASMGEYLASAKPVGGIT